jgi:flagellin
MIINTNMGSLNAQRSLVSTNSAMQRSLEKLSSGYRINKASDDAAGLAISEKMRGQIKGLNQAQRNAQDGISLIQTAEGALNETHSILQRMRELVVQAGNGTNATEDLKAIQDEINTLATEIDGIGDRTQFNGKTLLDGSFKSGTATITFQIGANSGQNVGLNIADMKASALTVESADINVNQANFGGTTFNTVLGNIDTAINSVSSQRSALGALQNRLEHTINNLGTASENLTAAESRIRDVDMAKEMSQFTKNQVLSQAGVAMLAQANQTPQAVLKLLG